MKPGDNVKAFVQVGLMRKPKWLKGVLVGRNTVRIHDNTISLNPGEIKLWIPIGTEEIKKFAEENWSDLKNVVSDSVRKFFPEEKITVDEEEHIIYIGESLSVGAGCHEIQTIASMREIPVWHVTCFKYIPSTRWEPADADEVNCGHSVTTIGAAKIVVDNLWSSHTEGYWDSLQECRLEME